MRNRKRLLKCDNIRFIQTFGTAHQESRGLSKWTSVQDTQKIDETGNVHSTIESQGFREKRTSVPEFLKLIQILREMTSEPEGRFVPEIRSQDRTKGQPEGYAVTGKTRKPWVANPGLVSGNAAGQNNSNLTPPAASVANGEWELLLGMVPIIVLYKS